MLIDSARPQDWPRHLVSLADLLQPVLAGAARLPAGLLDAALDSDRAALHAALAGNEPLLAAEPALRDRLAATGSVDVARIVLAGRAWSLAHRRLVLRSARPAEPGWHGADGLIAQLLADSDV